MISAQEFVAFLIAATILASRCDADHHLPAPTNLTFEWINLFTVNVSWLWVRPADLPQSCVKFDVHVVDHDNPAQTTNRFHSFCDLTETVASNEWEVRVHALSTCSGWHESKPASRTVSRLKSYAKLVNDFKCYRMREQLNCSWIPVDSSADVSYWYRERNKDDTTSLTKHLCNQSYSVNGRKGCILKDPSRDLFVLTESDTEMSTFKAQYAIHAPKLDIKEDGDYLRLAWTDLPVGELCKWEYSLRYKECNVFKSMQHKSTGLNSTVDIPYNKCCEYEFQYKVSTTVNCPEMDSDNSDIKKYDTTKSCFKSTSVVAIVIPIILCACVILSFYCFNRNRDIFCIKLPNHFEIKNMVNEILEKTITKDKVYTPQTEHTETLISFASENTDLQQKS